MTREESSELTQCILHGFEFGIRIRIQGDAEYGFATLRPNRLLAVCGRTRQILTSLAQDPVLDDNLQDFIVFLLCVVGRGRSRPRWPRILSWMITFTIF